MTDLLSEKEVDMMKSPPHWTQRFWLVLYMQESVREREVLKASPWWRGSSVGMACVGSYGPN